MAHAVYVFRIRMNQLIQFGNWMAYLLNGDLHHTCTYIQYTYVHTYKQWAATYVPYRLSTLISEVNFSAYNDVTNALFATCQKYKSFK